MKTTKKSNIRYEDIGLTYGLTEKDALERYKKTSPHTSIGRKLKLVYDHESPPYKVYFVKRSLTQ